MRFILLFLSFLFLLISPLLPREISLDYCTRQALEKSPLQKKKLYYQTKNELEEESVSGNYYPKISLDGQAAYQSDVIEFSFPFPGAVSPEIPNDQYKVNLHLQQLIWDGGITSSKKNIFEAEQMANINAVDVSLQQIKEMINGLYFKILFLQKSVQTLEINKNQLDTNRFIIESLVKNGVMYRSDLENITIQIIRLEQKINEVQFDRFALIKMLAEWIEEPLDENVVFKVPEIKSVEYSDIKRPEYDLFASKSKVLDENKKIVSTKLTPKIFLFGLAGYGSPNQFNMFESDWRFSWMAGLRFQWEPFDWSTTSKKKESLDVGKNIISAERENFDKNLRINIIKTDNDIKKFEEMMKKDEMIIKKQELIVKEYFSRLKNSTITITDYLLQVNNLLKTNINYELHKLKKIYAEVDLLTKTGNL